MTGDAEVRTRLGGILKRKAAWRLSFRGWVVAVLLAGGLLVALFFEAHPFLALTSREDASLLIVEGWIPDYALQASLGELARHHYDRVLSTGGLCKGGVELEPDDTYARLAAARLRHFGVPKDQLEVVPAAPAQRDRTYASALAVRDWLSLRAPQCQSVNVLTLDVHARRTRLLFQKALGGSVTVGVIAVENHEYDPKHWWEYSEGVKEMLAEGTAYLYARLLFRPEKEP